jgi:uncharacterized BrkB/YihY/UPF0761 family membrane protein
LRPELTRPSVRVEGYSQCPFTARFSRGATERLPRQSASMVTSMSWVSVAGKTRCEAFSSAILSLITGVAGAVVGGRGFANTLQHTLNTVGAVPRVDRPGFPRYLRTFALLLLLGLIVVVTAAASTAAATVTSLGFGGLPARRASLTVGTILGFGYFAVPFRVAAAGRVPMRCMLFGAAASALVGRFC